MVGEPTAKDWYLAPDVEMIIIQPTLLIKPSLEHEELDERLWNMITDSKRVLWYDFSNA